MPVILRIDGLLVVIYPNDHCPAHVNVFAGGMEAIFCLNCPDGEPSLRGNQGFNRKELSRIANKLMPHYQNYAPPRGSSMEITNDEFEQANANMKEMQLKSGTVTSATFDPSTRNIVLQLSTGIGIFLSPEDAQGLEHATAEQLSEIKITPSGLGLHFPQLNADLWVPSLLEGVLGSRKWMAARLGAAGGSKTSTAKASAARANGSLGGRPRRSVVR